ncbi:MAG: M56 family metallopeptidase [Saprospiraceae bacterium]|nr:M56 family metallopeptidase [Saprospiraceae bacterium]
MQPLFTCFTQNLNYALGWMVIHSLWQATAIAIISGITAISVRKKSPQLRYWIHNAALLAVFVAAVVTFCIYFDFSKAPGHTIVIPEKLAGIPNVLAANTQPTISNQQSDAPLSIEGMRMFFNNNIYLIVTVWVMGVALFILKLLGGISYVYYLRSRLNFPADEYWLEMAESLGQKAGVKKTIELVESALVRSPLVVGHVKPMILFPIGAINKLNPQEVEAILAHEIAHILRNDYIFNIIQSVIEALFYFHPAVWWISANIRTERENCCDDVAIALCGNSMTYAKALVSLQEMAYYGSPQMAMAFAGTHKNQLLLRVQRILKQPQNKTNVMEKLIATCLLLVMMVALSFGSNRWNNQSLAGINAVKPNQEAQYFIKFKENGVLDSFPVDTKVREGVFKYEDKMFTAVLKVKDHAVVSLNINGSEIPSHEIRLHARFINKIIMSEAPPQYKNESATADAIDEPDLVEQSTPTTPTPPMPQFSTNESTGEMVVTNPDGSQTIIEHPKGEGNILQRVVTTQRNGSRSITTTNKRGETWTEIYDKKGKKITATVSGADNGNNVWGGFNQSTGDGASVNNNGFNKQNYYDSNVADIDDLKEELKDLKEEVTECQCQTNVAFRKKLIVKINGVLDALNKGGSVKNAQTEFENIKEIWENGECDDNKQNQNGYYDNNGNVGYNNTNYKSNNNNGYGWSNSGDWRNAIQKELMKDGYIEIGQSIGLVLNANSLVFNDHSFRNDNVHRKYLKIYEQSVGSRLNGTVTMNFTVPNNVAVVSKPNKKEKDDTDYMQLFFLDMVQRGLVPTNQQVTLTFSNSGLKIGDRTISDNVFQSVKREFESHLPKPTRYSIAFNGRLSNVSATGLNISGQLTSSMNDK